MKKRIVYFLAICLALSGCSAVPEKTVATVTMPPAVTTGATPQAADAETTPVVPAAAPQPKTAGGTAAYQIASSVDPASQAFYDSLNRESEVFRAFDAVMNGNAKLTHAETGDSNSITSMLQRYAAPETPTIRQMTVVDLNQDGVLELILQMQTSTDAHYGFLLLSYSGGRVYCKRVDNRYFQELKTDGSFRVGDSQTYARLKDPTGMSPAITYTSDASEHNAKVDAIWFGQWMDLIYPGAAGISGSPIGVLEDNTQLTDTARQERINLEEVGQLLMPQEIKTRIVQCTAIDLDWDGVVETVLQIGTESDDYVGFVILRQDYEQFVGQGYYYRSFFELRTDGSYAFSSGANDSGYGMLTYQNGQWMESVLAQTYETTTQTGNAHQVYFVGGEMTTKEAYERFVEKQNAKPLQPWYSSLAAMNAG